ncbi:MAG: helix-turn-helix domain-containing protein [Firmicutes bacterium]|nr:helix-turn-helix domain-containing protein [Bacillota bacterium]
MKKDYASVCMNPIRQRIMQCIILNKEATTTQIAEALSDVPRASLYRHIGILTDAEVIKVVDEEKRRGGVLRTYAMSAPPVGDSPGEMNQLIQTSLIQLGADYAEYFSRDDVNPQRDLVTLAAATIMMTDEEYMVFLQKYAELIGEAVTHEPAEGRKERKVAFLSIPK